MHSLAADSVAENDLGHRRSGYYFHDCVIALLHDAQLHEHGPATLRRELGHDGACPDGRCQASGEAVVSRISRTWAVLPRSVPSLCDNVPYGFKGAPSARQARARLAQGSGAGDAKCRTGTARGKASMTTRARASAGNGRGLSASGATGPASRRRWVARRYGGLRHRARQISAGDPSNGADDSFAGQDHSQGGAFGTSVAPQPQTLE